MSGRQRYSTGEVVEALRSCGGLVTLAARQLGCHRATVENYCDRSPTVRRALDEAREQRLDAAEAMLFSAIDRGELPAVMFYLKTVGRRRGYGDHVQLDATVDVLQTPGWLRTRTLLLEVLRAYPEAQLAVVTRLRALEAPPQEDVDQEDDG